jgi:porin
MGHFSGIFSLNWTDMDLTRGQQGRNLGWAVAPAVAAMLMTSCPARAQDDNLAGNRLTGSGHDYGELDGERTGDEAGPSILDSVPTFESLAQVRNALADRGFRLEGAYIGDPYADLAGGMRQGATYSGRLNVEFDVDAEKVVGLKGGTLHANMYQIHGASLSENCIGNLLSTNDIAALPTTRLYELWYEQSFGERLSVRVGQQGIDVEFLTSDYADNFIDASFGWPGLPSADLPDGAPAYPLATPAVRVKFEPFDNLDILAAIFDGDPAGPGPGEPQERDLYGINFRVTDPPLVFIESQYRYNRGQDATGLPGTLKLGAFGHFGEFNDQQFGTDGLPLDSIGSNGIPLMHSPDGGFYGIIDQQIYRLPGDDPHYGIGVFARAIGAPPDRNPINFYFDAGIVAFGLVPGRPHDFFGVASAYDNVSPDAAAADEARNAATGIAAPVRNFETAIEVTYGAEILPGIVLQPTFQYFVHPGGNIADPYGNGLTPIPDAKAFGVTTIIGF